MGPEVTLMELRARILARIEFLDDSSCWFWAASANPEGYGYLDIQRKRYGAHRIAYLAWTGRDPGHLMVLHECDTPRCVNPEHLKLGTAEDNAKDMAAKGRSAFQRRR